MRYSTVFAGLIAVVAAAPINVPTLPVVGDLPELPALPVDLPVRALDIPALPVDLPALPVDVPEVPELPELPVDLPIKRAVTELVDGVLPEEIEDLIPVVDGLVRRVAITVDEQKIVSVVEDVVELLSELIHVDGLPSLPSASGLPALPVKRATIDVDEQRVIAIVEHVIELLSELINVDANLPEVPALPVKRATVTVGEDKVIATVEEVIAELSELIHVDAPVATPTLPETPEVSALPVVERQLLALPELAVPDVEVISTVTAVIAQLTGLLAL